MSKKLTSQFLCSRMMLPEHCSKLQNHADQLNWDEAHRCPELDEQQQEKMQQVFEQALAGQTALEITTLTSSGYQLYSGIPVRSNQAPGLVYLRDREGKLIKVKAREVVTLSRAAFV
ncbi:MAG: YolD-like family protein [Bacillota bacterium]